MTRKIDITTGQTVMTDMNKLRHFLSMAKKMDKPGNYLGKFTLYTEMSRVGLDTDICSVCKYSKGTKCSLQEQGNISSDEIFTEHCFKSLIRLLENKANSKSKQEET